jgi:O-antigen/teichoic acid export membrane protein
MLLRTGLLAFISTSSRVFSTAGAIVVLARLLPPDRFGILCLALSWAYVLGIIADWGLAHSAWCELIASPGSTRARVRRDLLSKAWLTIGYFAAAGVVFVLFFRWEDLAVFFGIAIVFHITQLGDYLSFVLRAIEPISKEASLAVWSSLFYALAVIGAGIATGDVFAVVVAMLAARVFYASGAVWMAQRAAYALPRAHTGPSDQSVFANIRKAAPVAADIALVIVAGQLDMILAGALLDRHQSGIYAGGSRIVLASSILTTTVANVFIPLALSNRGSESALGQRSSQLILSLTGLGVLALAGFILFGPLVVRFIYGHQYEELNNYWWLFGSFVCMQYWGAAFGILLNAFERQSYRATVQLIVLPLVTLLAPVVIPGIGIKALILLMFSGAALSAIGYFLAALKAGFLTHVNRFVLGLFGAAFTLLVLIVGYVGLLY